MHIISCIPHIVSHFMLLALRLQWASFDPKKNHKTRISVFREENTEKRNKSYDRNKWKPFNSYQCEYQWVFCTWHVTYYDVNTLRTLYGISIKSKHLIFHFNFYRFWCFHWRNFTKILTNWIFFSYETLNLRNLQLWLVGYSL